MRLEGPSLNADPLVTYSDRTGSMLIKEPSADLDPSLGSAERPSHDNLTGLITL